MHVLTQIDIHKAYALDISIIEVGIGAHMTTSSLQVVKLQRIEGKQRIKSFYFSNNILRSK